MTALQKVISKAPSVRSISILGSTGSVGVNTVNLVELTPERFSVKALSANRNVFLLAEQARKLRAEIAVIADESCYRDLKKELSGHNVEVAAGRQAVIEAAMFPSDWVMSAIVGTAGLEPTFRAVERGAIIGLANKECLVSAGKVMTNEVKNQGATIIPVDSEHSAIFQVFDFENVDKINRIILTASGGPFRKKSLKEMATMTPEQAIAHPNWDMGVKVSVDSATMMNKGLELIEAYHLFPVGEEKIEILVHPQSVVHSLVDYVDGSVLAQMGTPDMRTPISYALGWPQRLETPAQVLNLQKIGNLSFEDPDEVRFPALRLAREALKIGGNAPTTLNAANEIAVEGFLNKKINFIEITTVVENTLENTPYCELITLDDVLDADCIARKIAKTLINK
ncbi:MAG: 1-deoxy-D-xylulose-5-phosphate reductoisomerase [Magnetovibrio sp.]|nr:1-deoxy-D-xylulose-5-phosphate reductoisomerase [Magnetovibrio sp.]|tara:strand:+ start:345 stop:1532 length:1188 start_codon:yes stop_codon:yes gene_type:complete